MNPEDVNYQPLETLKHATFYVMNNTWEGGLWALAILSGAAGVGLTILAKDPRSFILAIVPISIYIGRRVAKFKNAVWDEFAAVNGWGFDTETPLGVVVPPSLLFGHSQHFSPVIQAQVNDLVCDLLSYDTTTGEGKSQTTHYFTVAVIKLPKPMPHMLLRKKMMSADVENDFVDSETLQLEGDFSDYFKLQIEKGQEIDALAVISPDVMQTMVDYDKNEDLEMVGDNLYFIVRGDKRDPASVRQLITSVIELGGQLIENAKLTAGAQVSAAAEAPVPAGSLSLDDWDPASLRHPDKLDKVFIALMAFFLLAMFVGLLITLVIDAQY